MTLGTKSLLALSVCAALSAACKKTENAASGSGSTGSGTATAPATVDDAAAPAPAIDAAEAGPVVDAAAAAPAATLPPELEALDGTIAPILAMDDKAARTKAACAALDTITTQMAAVRKNPPAGVDAAAWTEIAERMAGGLGDFELECGVGSASDTKALAEAAETAKELHALLATQTN
jgi:hypothetical protein